MKQSANLPLELFNKHREALGLVNPIVIDSENALFATGSEKARSALVFLPKSRALIDMTLALVSGMVKKDGIIVLAGANDAGIGSAKKSFEKNIGPVEQKIVGNHSALYIGKNKELGSGKKIEDFLSYTSLSYDGISFDVANLPGVFSAGDLDEGTELLLSHIPYSKKKVLDVGCGAGVIGALYKKKNPTASIVMTDMSKLAVMATNKTLEKNALTGEVLESDVFSNVKGTFDLIVTNPPFHKGIDTDYSFIEKFARDAKKYLEKGGEVFVVANSFLPYEKILEKSIGPTTIVIDTKRFRVLKSVCA